MLDSLQNDDSFTTLLGMLRTRLEGLPAKHRVFHNWQIHVEPHLSSPTPSGSLHVARIVQEAITNIVKHIKATTSTVHADPHGIVATDDGIGFDVPKAEDRSDVRHVVLGAKRRTEAIGQPAD